MKQTPEHLRKLGFIPVTEALPRPNQPVIAMTSHFRCLSILDSEGKWRTLAKKEEVLDVIAWAPAEPEKEP